MKYGLVDIGSNTVVLVIYNVTDLNTMPTYLVHESNAVRLVSYIKDGHMQEEGIQKAVHVLHEYKDILEQNKVEQAFAFITEPARGIDNCQQMLDAFQESGFTVQALTGKEEAEFDFFGSQLAYSQIASGNAFDIGGGSTEFITFKDHSIVEATSIPYGCVRLSQLPLDFNLVNKIVSDTLLQYPLLNSIKNEVLIGIGGTCRAVYKLMDATYHTGQLMDVKQIQTLYQMLIEQDSATINQMKKVINKDRQAVLLPGMNMLLAIANQFQATQIRFSPGCVREGFLYHQIKDSF